MPSVGVRLAMLGGVGLIVLATGVLVTSRRRTEDAAEVRYVSVALRRVSDMQKEQRKLLESALAAEDRKHPPCFDKHEQCPKWKPCCPGADGMGSSCGAADCSAPGVKPCEGAYTKDHCQVTCGTCPAGTRPVPMPAPPTPAPPADRPAELLALWEKPEANGKMSGTLEALPDVSWKVVNKELPRAVYLTNVLTPEEATALVEVSRADLRRSTVVHPGNQTIGEDTVRTSSGMWLTKPEQLAHPSRHKLIRAMSAAVELPEENFEMVQILRYEPGQYYVHHSDWFESHMKDQLGTMGQRVATGICFLNTVAEGGGGHTKLVWAKPEPVSVRPQIGDALVFYDVDRKWRGDRHSEHEAVPPKPGHEKWVAITWIRERKFQ
eukprot:TRINITY_DN6908_c0_g1_i1.p2 TRINITY_DN6908_c0_g1~~TRINITY_DN6908_c0_g1_i1.p2  ORF type:complete len:379 (+),score=86.04 TRINITY_DN6908_c0_g1_i1:73-1209(+)